MFATKKRSWIEDKCPFFPYPSWKDWVEVRPYDFLWKDYRPVFWNIRDKGERYELQIFFLQPTGGLDFVVAIVRVTSEDESQIQAWMEQKGLPRD
jgi:hypothetical protein